MFLISIESAAESSIVTDKEALISLKSGMSLSPSFWDHNSSPCNWTGVVCSNKRSPRVVVLDLSGLGITGSISPSIGNLSFLHSLQLQNNKLSGNIPSEIVNLNRLRALNLSSNAIGGSFPSNMTQLAALQVLDFTANNITGILQLGHLPKLRVLNLAKNKFYGSIPTTISNLSLLTDLNLGTNSLSGMIPSELGLLHKLQYLDLSLNQLTGTIAPSIYNLSSLVYFTVASNQLWGEIPTDIGYTLPNLLHFRNCLNKFTGKIPFSLHNISSIRSIRMSNNFLEGTVPLGLGNLPDLEMYNIGFNKIVSRGRDGLSFLTSLTNSTRLLFLAIDANRLEGVIPESIGNLSKVLSKLYIGGNRIHGNIPASIGHLKSLTLLNMSYNSIYGEIPTEIGQLEQLQMLGLAGNKMSGLIPNSLGTLQKLNQIDLSRNYFVGPIPAIFANFQKLLSMDLSHNMFNGTIPREVVTLTSLSKILNLSSNYLSGPLPEDIGLLENLVTLDLSRNNLSGPIPSSIVKCASLERLIMANNTLSGPLPIALQEMRGLEILDLSFNDFEGAIPSGGVFKNSSNVLLQGNPKLCQHFSCVVKNTQAHRRRKLITVILIVTTFSVALVLCIVACWLFCVKKNIGSNAKTTDLTLKGQHQMISYEELRRATENFSPESLLGKGNFGSVYKGYLREGVEVAVKVLDISRTGSWKSFFAECEALKSVRHRNLVKLVTSCSSLDYKNMEFLALVYEYLSNGSLEDWIKGKKRKEDGHGLNIEERLSVAVDVACGLEYLHHDCEVPVVHCDLKPSNILLDRDMVAKVGDFGLAKLLIERNADSGSTQYSSTNVLQGSIGYIPPEYGFGQKPSTAGDAYSFGVMLLELFTGKCPTHESFTGDVNLIKWVQLAFPHNLHQVLDHELLGLMDYQPEKGHKSILQAGKLDCLTSTIEIGLHCTSDSPDDRISLRNALHKLKNARDTLSRQDTHNLSIKD
ncbi:hypothetical protein AQUCO_01200003v1 [Aquilegia coerulea]|uniref:non-specific serine/threonine protein kinase n=1 Tax=Aquilegia coerulea TaxID=218851 RepID=A0A2G5E460_AQUCA|nr:hypothetical protein AQUCO_01200003v1 [Aquilegia coerulea]